MISTVANIDDIYSKYFQLKMWKLPLPPQSPSNSLLALKDTLETLEKYCIKILNYLLVAA